MRRFVRAPLIALGVLGMAVFAACGGDEDPGGNGGGNGSGGEGNGLSVGDTARLETGDIEFDVTLKSVEKVGGDAEVRKGPGLVVSEAPAGSSWYAFEVEVTNTSDTTGANTPDSGVACGGESLEADGVEDAVGFVVGEPPYAADMLEAGASNTGVIPLAVPDSGADCKLVLRMDALHGGEPEVEFSFSK